MFTHNNVTNFNLYELCVTRYLTILYYSTVKNKKPIFYNPNIRIRAVSPTLSTAPSVCSILIWDYILCDSYTHDCLVGAVVTYVTGMLKDLRFDSRVGLNLSMTYKICFRV